MTSNKIHMKENRGNNDPLKFANDTRTVIDGRQNLLPNQGEVYYFPEAIDEERSSYFFDVLLAQIPWRQEPVKLFGREIMQPRLTAWHGDPDNSYTYSGITMKASPWTPELLQIKGIADRLSGVCSNSVLLNLYRDGNDGMGWHRDNEKMLGKMPTIASVSFGATRTFQLRNYHSKQNIISINLNPGSILIMKGESQQHWEHRLPKKKSIAGVRINLTFRQILRQLSS
jgi:alkylated DNA repair dioxygenase AlkB